MVSRFEERETPDAGATAQHHGSQGRPIPAVTKTVELPKLPNCDLQTHNHPMITRPAQYDAPTTLGPWGYMCESCMRTNGLPGGFRLTDGTAA